MNSASYVYQWLCVAGIPSAITLIIKEISIAYYFEFNMQNNNSFHAYVFPCWYIKGYESMHSTGREKTHLIQDLYRIPDGIWYYPE